MLKVPLKIPGGGLIEIHGPWPARRLLLMLSREDFTKDHALAERIIRYFCKKGFTVVKYETELMIVRRTLQSPRLAAWPKPFRRVVKAAYLLSSPRRWRFLSKTNRTNTSSLDQRVMYCRALLDLLAGPEIFIWGRSAGGLLASHVVDGTIVRKLVVMGYPFRRPGAADEPFRYTHLAGLQTPCLILQGMRDPYGGADIVSQYRIAPSTRIDLVDTDHNFQLSEDQWTNVLSAMHVFLNEPGVVFPTGDS